MLQGGLGYQPQKVDPSLEWDVLRCRFISKIPKEYCREFDIWGWLLKERELLELRYWYSEKEHSNASHEFWLIRSGKSWCH